MPRNVDLLRAAGWLKKDAQLPKSQEDVIEAMSADEIIAILKFRIQLDDLEEIDLGANFHPP